MAKNELEQNAAGNSTAAGPVHDGSEEVSTVRKRSWYRYSLRTCLVLLTLVTVVFGYLSNRASNQRAAVAQLKSGGFSVEYDPPLSEDSESLAARILGVDFFASAVKVESRYPEESDLDGPDLIGLSDLPRLESLVLEIYQNPDAPVPITFLDFEPLVGCRSLKEFSFFYDSSDDELHPDFEPLGRCDSLTSLSVSGFVSREFLQAVSRCRNLKTIRFCEVGFDAELLAILANAPSLRKIELDGCAIILNYDFWQVVDGEIVPQVNTVAGEEANPDQPAAARKDPETGPMYVITDYYDSYREGTPGEHQRNWLEARIPGVTVETILPQNGWGNFGGSGGGGIF